MRKRAAVTEDGPGQWRIERKPPVFKLGIDCWTAKLRANGGLVFSKREWRPDPNTTEAAPEASALWALYREGQRRRTGDPIPERLWLSAPSP
ncbi:MAG: hypothetical protein ACLQMH_05940 [Solirubrobacteraceae bacterium]